MAACKIAGVQPTYTYINGQDPVSFIISNNINHRFLNQGQKAVLVVKGKAFKDLDQPLIKAYGKDGRWISTGEGLRDFARTAKCLRFNTSSTLWAEHSGSKN